MNAHVEISADAATVDQLIAIWSRTLQISPITSDSNFFELGGDSLLAVNLFLEIERVTGHHFPITAIYDAPTVGELATLMLEEAPAPFSPLVLLKDGGAGEPLFIVHGVGGTVIDLAALGKLIESDGPVYAIQARGIDGQEPPLRTIEAMADYYVDVVREVSSGPYRLSGYSFGGMVAVEMARRFGPANVDKLILLDSFAHPQTWPRLCRLQVRTQKLARQIWNKAKQGPRELTAFLASKAQRILSGKQTEADRVAQLQDWLGAISPDLPAPLREARIAGSAALLAYFGKPYPGKAIFLRAAKTGAPFPSNARRVWKNLVAELHMQAIPGSHPTIVGKDAATTAKAISAHLRPS
jgi:acetoacetyl-CoA synthetase